MSAGPGGQSGGPGQGPGPARRRGELAGPLAGQWPGGRGGQPGPQAASESAASLSATARTESERSVAGSGRRPGGLCHGSDARRPAEGRTVTIDTVGPGVTHTVPAIHWHRGRLGPVRHRA